MRAPARIHAFACTLAGAPASLRSLLGSSLVDDAETGTLRVSGSLYTLDDGSQWFLSHADRTDVSSIVVRLAAASRRALKLVRVSLDTTAWASAPGNGDDDELPEGVSDTRCLLVEPNRVMHARDEELTDEPWYAVGDEYETVDAALRVRTIGERQVVERTPVDGYVLPDAHGLSAKLEQLREAIAQAGGYDFVTVQGQRMLRVAVPDGAKRMVVVTDTELEALKRALESAP